MINKEYVCKNKNCPLNERNFCQNPLRIKKDNRFTCANIDADKEKRRKAKNESTKNNK